MKVCPCCGDTFDALDFKRRVGTMSSEGEVLLLANCDCGSTSAVVLIPSPENLAIHFGEADEEPEEFELAAE